MSSGSVDLGQSFGGGGGGVSSLNGQVGALTLVAGSGVTITPGVGTLTIASTGGGGTVTSVSVVSANGLSGTVATATTTPAITLAPTFTGITYSTGSGFQTAIAANFPTLNQNTTGTAANITATSNSTITSLPSLLLPGSQVSGNISGNAANITATSNSTLTSLPSLSLPGGQVGGFTSGSIIFAGATGFLAQDNANLFWNDTTFNLGLGLIPATNIALDIVSSTGTSKAIQTTAYGVGSSIPFRGRFARGSVGTPAAAQSGDNLSVLSGRGYGTSQFAVASTGAINIIAGETFTNTSNATYLQFNVTNTGSVTLSEAMRVSPAGNLLIGTTTDSGTQKLQVNGNSNVGTVTAGVWNGTNIAIANGGTNLSTTPANGQTLIGNGTGYTLSTITAGNGITVTNASGSITVATTTPYNYTVVAISSNTSAASGTTYLANTSGAGFTVTMPAPSSGAYVLIKDVGGVFQTNNLTIAPHASEQIEGLAASYLAQTNYGSYTLVSDGTNWWFI
jgi:trimeric autotransporter adhesin